MWRELDTLDDVNLAVGLWIITLEKQVYIFFIFLYFCNFLMKHELLRDHYEKCTFFLLVKQYVCMIIDFTKIEKKEETLTYEMKRSSD